MTRTYNEGLEAAAKWHHEQGGKALEDARFDLSNFHEVARFSIRALKREEAPEPVYKSVERILDEHSAWISRPSDDVTRAVALAATIAAFHALEKPKGTDPRDEIIRELMGALEHARNNMGHPDQLIDEAIEKAKGVVDG